MLVSNKNYTMNPPLAFVKDELKLAFTEEGKWKLLDDLRETEEPIQVETFSFGNCYGVIRYEETEESYIKIKGITWYIITDKETNMPMLKNREAQSYNNEYLDLKPINYGKSIFQEY